MKFKVGKIKRRIELELCPFCPLEWERTTWQWLLQKMLNCSLSRSSSRRGDLNTSAVCHWMQRNTFRSEHNGLILKGSRIVVPKFLRGEILLKIHEGHQCLVKCRERASSWVSLPGLSAEQGKFATAERCVFIFNLLVLIYADAYYVQLWDSDTFISDTCLTVTMSSVDMPDSILWLISFNV